MEQNDPGFHDPDNSAVFEILLDAGCGTGLDAAALALRVQPGGSVVGLDVSSRFVAVANERYGATPGLSFKVASVEDTGFPDAYFDGACCMRTLQYMSDPMVALRELVRVMRPGGRVVVVEGGMATVDLPGNELKRYVFGPREGFGAGLFNLMRDAGLARVAVHPAFGFDTGRMDPRVREYA